MTRLHGIRTVVRTESKLFARSWLFRFFMVFTVAVIVFLSWFYFYLGNGGWMIRSIPSSFPYFLSLSLTVFESLIVIFGSIDSMQRDTHLHTYASLHTRDISNLGYLMGKIIGVLKPCLILNAVFIFAAIVADVFFIEDVAYSWQSYILYPLILLVPALVFITGLSFLVTALVKSTPLAMFLLVGYFALTFLYRDGIFARVIDFMALHQPLLSSSIIGFGNLGSILLQRGMFFFLGIAAIMMAGVVFNRLPQSMPSIRFSRYTALASVVVALIAVTVFVNGITRGITLREHIAALNEEYVSHPRARMTSCDLNILHKGSNLDVEATLTLENQRNMALNSVVLSLNPGFAVQSVTDGGADLDFTRNTQIIEVALLTPLEPGKDIVLTVSYEGTVDDEACYPDIAPEDHLSSNRVFAYVIDKRYGFITPDYILLTPECQWYPNSGIPYGLVFPDAYERDFTDFTVDITTREGLTVVSQGAVESSGSNSYTIQPETPLPGLTLAVGEYEKKALDVDGVEIAIYHLPGHDYFAKDFLLDEEEIRTQLRMTKNNCETDMGMSYPFSRFSLVESPIQFIAWERPWKTYIETAQPQLAIVPELGFYVPELGIQNFQSAVFEEMGFPQDVAKIMIEERIGNIVFGYFMNDRIQRESAREKRISNYSLINFDLIKNPRGIHYRPGYSSAAQFFPFLASFESNRFPVFNNIMEFYRKYGLSENSSSSSRSNKALLDEELICIALEKNTFENYLKNDTDFDTFNLMFTLKTNQFFGSIQAASDQTGFDAFLNDYIDLHAFQTVSYEQFEEAVQEKFSIDVTPIFENWFREIQLPQFEATDISLTEIIDREYTCYQTTLTVTNIKQVTGTIWIRTIGDRGFERETRFITLEGRQSKQVGVVTDNPPTDITINTLISKNLPIIFTKSLGAPREDHDAEVFEGERIVAYSPNKPISGTFVVDNLDSGFEIVSDPTDIDDGDNTDMYKYGDAPNDFIPPLLDTPPKRWGKAVVKTAYGVQKVALFTKGGSGDGKVIWHANIPKAGRYDLEYYIYDSGQSTISRNGAEAIPGASVSANGELILGGTGPITITYVDGYPVLSQGAASLFADYHLKITNGTTEHEITYMPNQNQPGWQYVGSFDLEAGQTDVCLSNKSEGKLIYADAIRWVRK